MGQFEKPLGQAALRFIIARHVLQVHGPPR
jgi:hypothetical protein